MSVTITKPDASEYDPYYGNYIASVPAGDLFELLESQGEETYALLSGLPEDRGGFRYAPGKWSIKDLVQHLSDSERVFAYRALRFGRGDETPLASFDQDPYAAAARAERWPLAQLATELRDIRRATLALARSFDEAELLRSGVASGARMSVRALFWVIAGHEQHHLRVLRERYLASPAEAVRQG